MTTRKPISPDVALARMQTLCSRAEQCRSDIRRKLVAMMLNPRDIDDILNALQRERYVDDARYSRAFALDRLRFSLWGRRKIAAALRAKSVGSSNIEAALDAIEPDEYNEIARRVMNAALAKAKPDPDGSIPYPERLKALKRAASRGFEPTLLVNILKSNN